MTRFDNAPSFPTVPTVAHKSLILLAGGVFADGSDGIPQVIDFIGPTVSGGECLLLRNRGRPRFQSGGLPMKTTSKRRQRRAIRDNSIGWELVQNRRGTVTERRDQSDRLTERDENRRGEVTLTVTVAVQAKHRSAGPVSHNPFRQGLFR